jgi:hypothetical protein
MAEKYQLLYCAHACGSLDSKQNPESDFETYLYLENLFGEPGDHSNVRKLNHLTQTYGNVSGLATDSLLHNMFLTKPPVKQVEIRIWDLERFTWKFAADSYGCRKPDVLTSGQGVTFGQVFEYTREILRGREDGSSVLQDTDPRGKSWLTAR